ncbi:AT-hook motif nuclear-localized protein 17-like [Lotus japonicus]|uniref:AT-hook motif nuclear-localized protein 17-like n=1 Tax=Lotus japonicus TaxID=34305 RepID=UPI00258A064E|nr:AT-hook motif nuclear-localized protein 17-like [Lotus japonicus]
MFSNSKLQQQHLFQPNNSRECQQTSEDDESKSSGGPTPSGAAQNPASGDGATIEIVRRPRGRPPGSKNRPKPPLIITREPEPALSPHILEIPAGSDVVEAISRFTRRKNTGLIVLTGSGTVANVTLRQPGAIPSAAVTFHGRFDILSVSATFLPHPPGTSPPLPNGFSISLAGPQGQIIGGHVAGRLVAAGTVFVIATSFNNASYERLQTEEDDAARNNSGAGEEMSPPMSGVDSGMYSCHLPSEVIWAPTARPPPPPPAF